MRYAHGALFGMLLLFAALQANDPDWYYWGPVYLLAAVWSWLAWQQPEKLVSSRIARFGAPLSVVFFLAGFLSLASYLGPGWIHIEEARESLGYLICAATTATALLDARRRSRISLTRKGGPAQ
jgi:hypothetical protein